MLYLITDPFAAKPYPPIVIHETVAATHPAICAHQMPVTSDFWRIVLELYLVVVAA